MLYEVITLESISCSSSIVAFFTLMKIHSIALRYPLESTSRNFSNLDFTLARMDTIRITSYNVCYTKLLRFKLKILFWGRKRIRDKQWAVRYSLFCPAEQLFQRERRWRLQKCPALGIRITSYNVCYTKLLRSSGQIERSRRASRQSCCGAAR